MCERKSPFNEESTEGAVYGPRADADKKQFATGQSCNQGPLEHVVGPPCNEAPSIRQQSRSWHDKDVGAVESPKNLEAPVELGGYGKTGFVKEFCPRILKGP